MGTPSVNGLVHFGYTKILSNSDKDIFSSYSVKMHTPRTIFDGLKELHFIKCDIEGFEKHVIPGFIDLIKRFKPNMQIEICSIESRELIINMLKPLGYQTYYFNFKGEKLIKLKNLEDNIENSCDLYFLNEAKIIFLKELIV
jgi:hypothetical protein